MIIDIIKYIVLGFVQGVAEILPISSSGHLALAESLLKVDLSNSNLIFTVFLHFASLLALIIFMWPIIWRIIRGSWIFLFRRKHVDVTPYKADFMLLVYLIVASIPVALVGVFLENLVSDVFGDLIYVGIDFALTGIILLVVGLLFQKKASSSKEVSTKTKFASPTGYTWKNTIITGLFECIGVLPGISRSGITMSGAKIAGMDDDHAKEFAFLLFIPVAAGSFIFSLGDVSSISSPTTLILYLSGMISAFIFTYLSLRFIFRRFTIRHYRYFAFYMFAISAFTIIYYFVALH